MVFYTETEWRFVISLKTHIYNNFFHPKLWLCAVTIVLAPAFTWTTVCSLATIVFSTALAYFICVNTSMRLYCMRFQWCTCCELFLCSYWAHCMVHSEYRPKKQKQKQCENWGEGEEEKTSLNGCTCWRTTTIIIIIIIDIPVPEMIWMTNVFFFPLFILLWCRRRRRNDKIVQSFFHVAWEAYERSFEGEMSMSLCNHVWGVSQTTLNCSHFSFYAFLFLSLHSIDI